MRWQHPVRLNLQKAEAKDGTGQKLTFQNSLGDPSSSENKLAGTVLQLKFGGGDR
ncbi:hypothetical protein TM239_35780 [Bradyrhizobium sp. TM239]|nr:hypothetical protein TM239_35780 [Bradyrhizobium sp. TM239]